MSASPEFQVFNLQPVVQYQCTLNSSTVVDVTANRLCFSHNADFSDGTVLTQGTVD